MKWAKQFQVGLMCAVALGWGAGVAVADPPPADPPPEVSGSLTGFEADDEVAATAEGDFVPAGATTQPVLIPSCGSDQGGTYVCYGSDVCFDGDEEGTLYDVLIQEAFVGQVCVTEQEAAEQEQVTPGRVLRAFRRLSWPRSDLIIQPPGGTTLVNFATNFYTDNTDPSRQRITLLRQGVLIEATPTTYTWHYGDGTTTSTPGGGAPYPALDVTHDYATVDTFAPRLDTTYTGRYRLNGGPWITIPETLTVSGATQSLETVEALPTLVDY